MQSAAADSEFVAFQRALAGEYSLERELGRGGMGIVYLARDVQLDRQVAIKVLPASLASRTDLKERFMREARTAAGLSHPNIVPIHRVGEAGEFVFFVMAYIDGESLGQRLREHGPLTSTAAAKLLREVAWALAYAHGRGVVHRDVKPDNILIERETGRALVTDFGIAQVA
ncbi:MAG TPA: serine/threonine-protein kinase, partial [Gemmatimonadaceae bacterium]|nr:serine/threonine-protein kinase [Gemmatimonadaceae bacterium]